MTIKPHFQRLHQQMVGMHIVLVQHRFRQIQQLPNYYHRNQHHLHPHQFHRFPPPRWHEEPQHVDRLHHLLLHPLHQDQYWIQQNPSCIHHHLPQNIRFHRIDLRIHRHNKHQHHRLHPHRLHLVDHRLLEHQHRHHHHQHNLLYLLHHHVQILQKKMLVVERLHPATCYTCVLHLQIPHLVHLHYQRNLPHHHLLLHIQMQTNYHHHLH